MILTTPRLSLRPQAQADAPALFAILNDPRAMRFWHRPAIARLAVVEELVREQQAAMANGVCRYWTVFENGAAIGSVDLSLIESASAELGFVLRRDRWGLGLASEAVGAVIAEAFDALGLTHLAAASWSENRAAARVLEKAGFVRRDQRLVRLAGGAVVDCNFYVLRRDQSIRANGK